MSILDDVAAIMNDALGDLVFYPATLHRPTRVNDGFRVSAPTWADHASNALVIDYSAFIRDRQGIPANERNVMILGASCAVIPTPGDVVTVQGASWMIVDTQRDPAAATYQCRSKPCAAPT